MAVVRVRVRRPIGFPRFPWTKILTRSLAPEDPRIQPNLVPVPSRLRDSAPRIVDAPSATVFGRMRVLVTRMHRRLWVIYLERLPSILRSPAPRRRLDHEGVPDLALRRILGGVEG